MKTAWKTVDFVDNKICIIFLKKFSALGKFAKFWAEKKKYGQTNLSRDRRETRTRAPPYLGLYYYIFLC